MSDCEAKGQEIIGPVVGADAVTPCPPLTTTQTIEKWTVSLSTTGQL